MAAFVPDALVVVSEHRNERFTAQGINQFGRRHELSTFGHSVPWKVNPVDLIDGAV
jgi:hypothetical protein